MVKLVFNSGMPAAHKDNFFTTTVHCLLTLLNFFEVCVTHSYPSFKLRSSPWVPQKLHPQMNSQLLLQRKQDLYVAVGRVPGNLTCWLVLTSVESPQIPLFDLWLSIPFTPLRATEPGPRWTQSLSPGEREAHFCFFYQQPRGENEIRTYMKS